MKVVLSDVFKTMSGTIGDLTYFTRNGQTYARCKSKTRTTAVRPSERAHRDRFKLVLQQVNEVMKTSYLRASYEAEWKKQKRYTTLRGYVFHCLYNLNALRSI